MRGSLERLLVLNILLKVILKLKKMNVVDCMTDHHDPVWTMCQHEYRQIGDGLKENANKPN